MSLRHAVLAALLDGDASGYELAKRFDVSVANFWSTTPQQLYRELERLETDGLLRGQLVRQQRRPDKRVFSLTPAGREELHDYTTRPARPTALRDELLVKLYAVDSGDAGAARDALLARRERARAKLAMYDRLRDDQLAGRSEQEFLTGSDRMGPYLTLLGGRMYEQQNIRWCTAALAALDRRADS